MPNKQHSIEGDLLNLFHARLTSWFGEHARLLPWRETNDPYPIWLSEVILQQTQVVQGMSYYHRFLDLFPDIHALAAASEDEVLRAWQGLGYYSRGRNLLRAARMIVEEFGGKFPDTLQEIKRLPGVGPYTQAAILSFAFSKAYAAVDGNVYRVLSRLFADDTPIDTPQGQKHFRALAEQMLNRSEPGLHNQSMIELGALTCTPRNPNCLFCPVQAFCQSYALGIPTNYPVKIGKTKVSNRYFHFVLVRLSNGNTLLQRRSSGDIWQGLYQFPLIESDQPVEQIDALVGNPTFATLLSDCTAPVVQPIPLASRQHRLTHRLIHAKLYIIEAEQYKGTDYLSVPYSNLSEYALPALLLKLLDDLHIGPTTR